VCPFCEIAGGRLEAHVVLDDDAALAFLDSRPLFAGHCLLIPRAHHPTLLDLPPELVGPLFANAQRLAAGVERAMGAQGTFVACNNRVSQSVAHFHLHVVPRRRKDGLRGFFWPRRAYESEEEMASTAERVRAALAASTEDLPR
jgi:histidine triad (HIT) family protein